MAQRRPFVPPTSVVAGDTRGGQTLPPQPGRMGARPPAPFGGNPGVPEITTAPRDLSAPGVAPGGPTSPLNIGQMLQPQPPGQPTQPMGQPQSPVLLPPHGGQGTRPSAPSRVPFDLDDATAAGAPGGAEGQMLPGILLSLLRKLGRV